MEEDVDDNSIAGETGSSQVDSEAVWCVGDSCRAKWSGDNKYYIGVIKKLRRQRCDRVSALIKFSDYDSDECEEVDIQQLLKVPRVVDRKLHAAAAGSTSATRGGENGDSVSGFFKPFTGSEESSRLEEKYGHESDSDSGNDSSHTLWISPSYRTKGKVSEWKIGSPAKSQTPPSERRKGAVAVGGSPRKKGRAGRKSSPRSGKTNMGKAAETASNPLSGRSCEKSPRNFNVRIASEFAETGKTKTECLVRDAAKDRNTSVVSRTRRDTDLEIQIQSRSGSNEVPQQTSERSSRNQRNSDIVDDCVNDVQESNVNGDNQFGGFGEDDMEKPKFSFAAPCAKVPYCLDEENKVQVPASLNQYLRDYQREGIRFLYSHYIEGRGAILGDDMGLGKTVQVIGFLSALLGKEGTRMDVMRQKPRFIRMMSDTPGLQDNSRHLPFLIIGPGSVLYNWLEEFETWGHFTVRKYHGADKAVCLAEVARGKVEVVVTTFETFRDNVVSLNAVDWEAVFVDEVHRIKGMKAQTTLALRTVPCLCRYGLTGTALQNNMSELWCILDWAQPEVLGSPENFVEEFVKPIERGQKHNATKRELAEARHKKDAFAKVRSQMMLRRTKKLIADQLPRKTDRVVFCRLTPLQVSVYKAVLSHPDLLSVLNMSSPCSCGSGAAKGKCCHQKTRGGRKLWSVMFSFMHVLLKTANHVALLIPHARTSPEQKQRTQNLCEIAFKDHPEFISQTQEAAFRTLSDPKYCGKMKVLQGMLSVFAKSHSKVLVFSYSTRLLDILEQHVISVGHEYRRIDGKVTGYKRQKIVREFNSDPNIFLCLISTKAGGLGLNMTGANKVVIFDPNWNPSHDLQAQDRAYRIGQRRDVEVFRLISAGTIEENIYLRQIYKQQLGNVAVGTENARRYFHGIQGDASNKGELFGVKNMFQLRTGNSCLTMDILHRNAKVEAGIAGHDMADYIPSSREQELAKGDTSLEEESDSVQDDEYSDDDESFFGLKDLFDAADTGDGASPKSVKTKARELPEDPLQSTSRERGAHSIPHKKNQHCEKGDLDETLEDDRSASRLVPAEGRGLRTGKSTASPKAKRNTRDEKSKRKEEKVSSPLKCTGIGDKKTEEREGGRAFHQALFDDSMKTPSFSSVSSVFEECGVIHVHDNPQVVGASRVEDYMSRCAVQDVFELKINTQAPALLCDPLSQPSEDEEEQTKPASGKGQAGKLSRKRTLRKDHNSSRTIEHGRWHILLGQTPAAIRRKHWTQLKEAESCQDDITLAQRVVTASPEERLTVLRDFYKKHHDEMLHGILDDVLSLPVEPADEKNTASGAGKLRTKQKTSTGSENQTGRKGQRKGKAAKQTPAKKTPAKRKHPARGLMYCSADDTEPSQSPGKRPSRDDNDSDCSSDLDVGAKVSPFRVKQSPQKQRAVSGRSPQSACITTGKMKTKGAKTRKSAARPQVASAGSKSILDFSEDSDGGEELPLRRGEDVEGLLQELGRQEGNCAKAAGGSNSKWTSPAEPRKAQYQYVGRTSDRPVREEDACKGREKPELSLLDDIFCDSSVISSTKRKPPPKRKKKSSTAIFADEVGVTKSHRTDVPSTSETSDMDSSRGVRSPDVFSDLLNNSTLQDDRVDCFADSSLWKKRKKVRKLPPKKIDRLLQETKDDYQELFESGRLVRKRKEGEAQEETGARLGCEESVKDCSPGMIDPSGSLFS